MVSKFKFMNFFFAYNSIDIWKTKKNSYKPSVIEKLPVSPIH